MTCGVYGIFDEETDVCLYVGQSRNIEKRYKRHLYYIKRGKHSRKDFTAWVKSGKGVYLKILEECADDQIEKNKAEIKWFNKLNPLFYGVLPSEKYVTPSVDNKATLVDAVCPFCKTQFKTFASTHGRIYCKIECKRMSKKFKSVAEYPKEADLRQMYVVRKMTTVEIASELGCSQPTVSTLLKKYDIPRRRTWGANTVSRDSTSTEAASYYAECGHEVDKVGRKFCDACLSQRDFTYKIDWPPLEDLEEMVLQNGYVGAGKILGVSNNAVKKHIQSSKKRAISPEALDRSRQSTS